MKKWFFTWLLLIAIPVMASHIVGGEFELLHINGNTYQLNMILYFDKVNGEPGAFDQNALVYIFQKNGDVLMDSVLLPFVSGSLVEYTQVQCANGNIITQKLIYSKQIVLPNKKYSHPDGYYLSWQRCCRNYKIVNVISHDPSFNNPNYDGVYAGQTFYLEFPPVVKNGQPFINSSPKLFPPLSDYASPYRQYYIDFSGIDDDGDSLVYSLVNPLSTTSDQARPSRSSAPYPTVHWASGYDSVHVTKGSPDMRITTDGILTCTPPGLEGLYVFAIKVEQFRDKIKIGESRRDFQMFVVDVPLSVPPQIIGKKLADPTYTYTTTMSVSYANTEPDGSRCIKVRVSDPDSEADPFTEKVGVKVVPLNFNRKANVIGISISSGPIILSHGSTAEFTICFPACPYIDGPYEIGVIAFDDACALPLTDTLRVTVNVQPPDNSPPHFTSLSPPPPQLQEGDSINLFVEAVDDDLDSMAIFAIGTGFNILSAGMKFTVLESEKGFVKAKLHWDAYCDIYDFTHQNVFPLRILVDDQDVCDVNSPVPTPYTLSVKLPTVIEPVISTNLPSNENNVLKINETLSFDVTGSHSQGDVVFLKGDGVGFDMVKAGAVFKDSSAAALVTSHFTWAIRCEQINLTKKDDYEFRFIASDPNKCRLIRNDTVLVEVKILPPDNQKPLLTITSQTATPMEGDQLKITRGDSVSLAVTGTDGDTFPAPDLLTLKLLSATGTYEPEGYKFSDTTGIGSVLSPFLWNPDCSIFRDGVYENDYVFRFSLKDDRCYSKLGDTLSIFVKIKDVESGAENFLPFNVITPNGDGCNDFFAMEGFESLDGTDAGCESVLDPDKLISFPKDNCEGSFKVIRIVNRWGKQVFESSDRKFRWYAQNESAGVYFYYIKFGNREYKGGISVRF